MLKKVGVLLLLGATLTGCSDKLDETTEEVNKKDEVALSTTKMIAESDSTANIEEYLSDMQRFKENIYIELKAMEALSQKMADNPLIIEDKEFVSRITGVAKEVRDNYKYIKEMGVPNELLNYHSRMIEVFKELELGANLYEKGSLEKNVETVLESSRHFVVAVNLLDSATTELNTIYKASDDEIYEFMVQSYSALTNNGENYNPEIHDVQVSKLASEKYGISEEEADRIYIQKEMSR
ncbi:hypothetical protein MHB44_08010 [Lysinibacillus sp. FSL H8-0500]|uniref:hypothetical protein n=1 Tax=Lysinibacillus sp. FSL H8-0500 TaxID=2921393 RepID=UPI0031018701